MNVLACLSMVLTSRAPAADIGGQSFAALRAEVNRLRPMASAEKRTLFAADAKNLTSCEKASSGADDGTLVQFIYSEVYQWAVLQTPGGFCIHLIRPISRDLSIEEASDLLAASRMNLHAPSSYVPPSPSDEPRMGRGVVLKEYVVRKDGTPVEK